MVTGFPDAAVQATEQLLAARATRLPADRCREVFTAWVDHMSAVYGMRAPSVEWSDDLAGSGGGRYRSDGHRILLDPSRLSVTTLLHEFRHAMQAERAGEPAVDEDVEVDARAWSCSLYYRVRPEQFIALVKAGRVLFVPRDTFG